MENMKFDVLLYNVDNIADALNGDGDLIRVEGLAKDEAEALVAILLKHEINVCLFPLRE